VGRTLYQALTLKIIGVSPGQRLHMVLYTATITASVTSFPAASRGGSRILDGRHRPPVTEHVCAILPPNLTGLEMVGVEDSLSAVRALVDL
jgi:hypothetical protein